MMPKPVVIEDLCKGCGLCVGICPVNAMHKTGRYDKPLLVITGKKFNNQGYPVVEVVEPAERCTGCMLCEYICPDLAIYIEK